MSSNKIDLSVRDNESFDLCRFVEAQSRVYDSALAEIRMGRKRTHWMWYIFPQLRGLGTSDVAAFYAISGINEARAYLAHPILGARLIECTLAMCDGKETNSQKILGKIDAIKFRSSMTLFERADERKLYFVNALQIFFSGVRDCRTLDALDHVSIR